MIWSGNIMRKDIFLKTTPLDEALRMWTDAVKPVAFGAETVKVADSIGRVTGAPVYAATSSPSFHSSAMDGYAVRFADTFGASEKSPLRLKIDEQAVYVNTGRPMPEGFNAVVMVEDVNIADGHIEIIKPLTPWKNVRVIGEDIVATELILPENHRIRPVDIGPMLAGGNINVSVRRRPVVVVIPTGSEIVEPEEGLGHGKIIEFNSRVMGGLCVQWGAAFVRNPIVPDEPESIKEAVLGVCGKADLIVINAGASAGTHDYTASVIRELGEVILHGVDIRPGKPLILGKIKDIPAIGAPGFPVAAYMTFLLFAKPVIYGWLGLELEEPERIKARLSRQVSKELGPVEFLRVKVGKVGENFIATPLGRGAGVTMTLVRADGILRLPAMSEGVGAGAEVEVELVRPKREVENTIVSIGSHDNTLDILSNAIRKKYPKYSLSSAHVGSMGGLMAIKKNEAHIAPTHLLDEETGEYNVPFIKKLLPDRKIILLNLLYRTQGFMVGKGNPKGIKGFEDLAREDVTFINRQRGAGTRLLLDKHLKESNIEPSNVKGYEREEFTHMAVASSVLTGASDTGLGILAAANALGLDFIPVTEERYDLAIPEEFYGGDMIQALLKIIREDGEFKGTVMSLGGYDIRDMGRVMYEG
jgi:putative molybdopterin biosynthesis protein